jgi:serine/threonine-protein kinase
VISSTGVGERLMASLSLKKKPLRVGETIAGKYRVERVLGEGGLGVVVRAQHLELQTRVAIKTLVDRDEEAIERFMREARAAVRLKGEHVAKILDVGTLKSGTPFMVMELLDGEDLGCLLDRGPLAAPDAIALVLQACEGLAEAHALGIVHRDVKPRNLFLTRRPDGSQLIKVLDFGIAKLFSPEQKDKALTATTAVLGSPPYMSPEQVRATRNTDVRTDIWSLGVTLYELLTQRLPFDGPTPLDIVAKILKDPPTPIREQASEVPEAVASILEKCLEKDAAGRFPNVHDLAVALEPYARPTARGSAERVREVLFAPQPVTLLDSRPPPARDTMSKVSTSNTTQTASTFGSVRDGGARFARLGIAGVAALGIATAVGWSAIRAAQPTKSGVTPVAEADPVVSAAAPASGTTESSSPLALSEAASTDAATSATAATARPAPHPPKRPAPLLSPKTRPAPPPQPPESTQL